MTADAERDDAGIDTRDDSEGDDEALSWGTSSDNSYVEGPATPVEPAADAEDDEDDELSDGMMSSAMLVVHGVFGGVYLLLTVAWLIAVSRTSAPSLTGFPLVFWHVTQYLGVVAAPLWFVTTIVATSLSRPRPRILWLVVGVLVLLPWPFIVGGTS